MGTSGAEVFWSPEGQGAGAWGPSLATGHAPSGAVHSGPGEEGPSSVHKFLCLGFHKAGKITSLSSPTRPCSGRNRIRMGHQVPYSMLGPAPHSVTM